MDPRVRAEIRSSSSSGEGSSRNSNGFEAMMIMALVVVVSIGYIFLWIMMSTNLYRQVWIVKIRAVTISTFFGTQG